MAARATHSRWYQTLLRFHREEDGADGVEYMALVGALVILLVLAGVAFSDDNGKMGEGWLCIFQKGLEGIGGQVDKMGYIQGGGLLSRVALNAPCDSGGTSGGDTETSENEENENCPLSGPDDEYVTFYHGTNTAGMEGIMNDGIDAGAGRPNLDFNPAGQGGFYVTNDRAQAQIWAQQIAARRGGSAEVIEIRIPRSQLNQLNGRTFNMPADQAEWGQTVRDGRAGNLHHNYDFVEGPFLTNPREVANGAEPRYAGHQLAIFTDPAEALFNQCLGAG